RELHLQQVFLNLLLNSLQAIPQKGNISIISTYEAQKRRGTVLIEDTGVGFSSQIRDKVFNPYFTTKEKGTGMGLFIVKRTLSKYNADIGLDSTEGSGTRCTLHFQL
ncbi:MAG TPA: ATP-binding protein, partial [Oscillospiraceae bacterium]|nr:ATP-binding protein [Oscillospiraceae bacterium]